jgi:hypothetical protein
MKPEDSPYPRPEVSTAPKNLHFFAVLAIWIVSLAASLGFVIGWAFVCHWLGAMEHLHGILLVTGMTLSFLCLPMGWIAFMVRYLKPRTEYVGFWASLFTLGLLAWFFVGGFLFLFTMIGD